MNNLQNVIILNHVKWGAVAELRCFICLRLPQNLTLLIFYGQPSRRGLPSAHIGAEAQFLAKLWLAESVFNSTALHGH